MQAFILSDINPPLDQVTALALLREGDTMDYYHGLTRHVQDDWFELMRVLGECFHCTSHERVYLSRMLTLREGEFR